MLGLFLMFSMIIWFLLDFLKPKLALIKLPDAIYDVILWACALAVGTFIAFQFKLDAFVLASDIIVGFIPFGPIEPSITGQVFGGLILASGSGGVNAFLKSLGGLKPTDTAR